MPCQDSHFRPADQLTSDVYSNLKGLASRCLKGRNRSTLQPTQLVHEAFLKLSPQVNAKSRTHYLAIAATAMRQVLVDHVRASTRQKRGGGRIRLTLQPGMLTDQKAEVDGVALQELLQRLEDMDARAARVVELKVFAGLSGGQIATELDISERTVGNDWAMARAWLKCALKVDDGGEHAA